MKKAFCLPLCLLLLAAALSGCKQAPAVSAPAAETAAIAAAPAAESAVNAAFTAQNEIFTYEKIDPGKTQIVVSRTGNLSIADLCAEFEARNPDIQVICLDITGGDVNTKPAADWIRNGCAPDVMFSTAGFLSDEDTATYFENLSADPILQNYEADALQRTATNANVYWLPGPSNINAMVYNKTLFQQYGWEIPNTFDEFVALCKKISEDTAGEIEPWNPNAKYSNEFMTVMQGFTYEELFGGVKNRAWYDAFTAGNATFAGHMEPYYETIKTLVENGILREEHFSYSATTRGKEFQAGKIAMINTPISDMDNETYDFGYMPFPTTAGELGYVSGTFSCLIGVPKKAHDETTDDAVKRFIAFFSTPEGQQVFIGNSLQSSSIKDVPLSQSADLAALSPAINAGHTFTLLDFSSALGASNIKLQQDALDITTGARTVAECIATADATPYLPATEPTDAEAPAIIGKAETDLTILETSFYIADAYREAMDAEIGLIANNIAYRGNLMRIFAGDIAAPFVNVLKPRSLENDSALVKVSMTGAQLLDALNNPPDYNDMVANCVYAYSGLVCEIAPWNALGEKYRSVKRPDGSDLDPEKLYTVALWTGTVNDAYITETLETREGTWEDMMTAKITADKTVSPANDGRIRLVWD